MSIMMETMGRTKRPRRSFTREFKAEVVELVRQPGNSVASVARDLDLTETAVRAWVKQADVDDGHREGLTSGQLAELAHLRKENRVLREERDILKRATAFFGVATVSWTRCFDGSGRSGGSVGLGGCAVVEGLLVT
jgi:transposase